MIIWKRDVQKSFGNYTVQILDILMDFMDNENYGLEKYNVEEMINTTEKNIQKKQYDYLVSINSPKVQGKELKQCNAWTELGIATYMVPTTSTLGEKESSFLDKYSDFFRKTKII